MSIEPSESVPDSGTFDRRQETRRAEDYFWLTRLTEVTGDGCLVVNRRLRIEYSDGRAAELLEIPEQSVAAGSDFSQLALHMSELGYFGPGDPRAFQALLTDLLTNQKLQQSHSEHTIRVTTPLGRQVVLKITYGRDDRFIILLQDMTEDYLEEQALSTALKIGESGYWHLNLKTREFMLRGSQVLQATGAGSLDTTVFENLESVIHPDDVDKSRRHIRECIRTRQPQNLTIRVVGGNGREFWIKNHMMPTVDEGNRVRAIICFFHDVTAQLQSQHELRSAQERAETALKAKTAFLGRLSHEVRTPMNAVIGMADALIHHHNDPEINPQLVLIQDSAEKIVNLVDETLQHSKLQAAEVELSPRDMSPRHVVERIGALWTEQARRTQTKLRVRIEDSVPDMIVMDDLRLEQCLNNLVSNAVKFTEGGTVDIIVAMAGTSRSEQLAFAVRDTGIGMSEEQLKQVFLPYKQADKSIAGRYGGTGLGMAITNDLAELMGGRIDVRSEEGRGTVFVLTLPLVLPEENRVGSDKLVDSLLCHEDTKPNDFSNYRVLIVDDNATNHMVVGSLLKSVVGETVTAMNGEEAIERLRDNGPFDLVLMDIHMPVMDGIEATLAIRSGTEPFADIPIIALTADPQYQQARLCKNIGMDDALAKPVRLSALLASFDTVMKSQQTVLSDAA